MGRALVRDQYTGEHWVDEEALAFAPWRDCEVIRVEPHPPTEEELAEAASGASEPPVDAPNGEVPSEPPAEAKPKPRRPAAE